MALAASRSSVTARICAPARRVAQEGAQADEDDEREGGQEQGLIGGVADAEQFHIAQQRQRFRHEIGLHAPHEALHILQDHEDGEGDEDLEHLLLVVDPLEQQLLHEPAQHRAHEDGGDEQDREGEPGIVAGLGEEQAAAHRHIGAQGVEAAMGDVQHAEHAEDEGEPHRHEEDEGGIGNAVADGEDDGVEDMGHLWRLGAGRRRQGEDACRDGERLGSAGPLLLHGRGA